MDHLKEIISVNARIRYWASRGSDYGDFVARIQKMTNEEIVAHLERYERAWPDANFYRLYREVALVRKYPREYLSWVLTIQSRTDTQINDLISFFSGVHNLTTLKKKLDGVVSI